MEVIMLLMVWNPKVSIAPISFLIQETPCNILYTKDTLK